MNTPIQKKKARVLIVGVSGFIGYNLAAFLSREYSVVGLYFSNFVSLPDVHTVHLDITKKDYLDRLVRMLRPDFTIMAAGLNDSLDCAKNPKLAEALNTYLPLELAQGAQQQGAKNIFLSCAQVFDGSVANAKEGDKHYATMSFGRTKLTGESYIRAQTMENTTIRFGKVIGMNHFRRPSYFDLLRIRMAKGERHFIREDKTYSFMSLQNFLRAMQLILSSPVPPVHRTFHLGGVGMKEMEMNKLLASWIGGNPNLVMENKSVHKDDSELETVRVDPKRNYTLDCSHFEATYPWKAETLEKFQRAVLEQLSPHQNWREKLQVQV